MDQLPIDAYVPEIVEALRRSRALVVTAAPGAGKTTRVPPALVEGGRVLLLQPRRVAARAIARRIADEREWTLGREVGWHVRFDRRASAATRLLVATEGILTARLQHDPLLADFVTVIIDEFHERSLHADLGLALVKQAWRARDDLRLLVMSATLEAGRVSAFLSDCPIVSVPGRQWPLDVRYQPGVAIEQAIAELLPKTTGAVLCFLPGAPEIRRAADSLRSALRAAVPILPLHGGLDADEQDQALRSTGGPRVVLATNVAETTLTVPDVTAVVDTGLHKVARYDPDRGIDSLELERISQDSADQRAGRAGRTQAGVVTRLWDARDRLRPHREPEIARVDLASTMLDVIAWGGNPRTLDWFDAPPPDAMDAAIALLSRLGAIGGSDGDQTRVRPGSDRGLTPLGATLQRIPVHPRLARLLIEARGAPVAARACALLSERHFAPQRQGATTCDLLAAVDREHALPPHVQRVAGELARLAAAALGDTVVRAIDDAGFRRAVLAGYPDRVARRRGARSDRFVMASGTGARQARESGVYDAEFVAAVDVAGGASGTEALMRLVTGLDREWLEATAIDIRHELAAESGTVRAFQVRRYDHLVLSEHPVAPDPIIAADLIAGERLRRSPTAEDQALLRRLRFAGLEVDYGDLVRQASVGARRLSDVDIEAQLPRDVARGLAERAPERLRVPSGRDMLLTYREDGGVSAAVKLQELFGLGETPRIGPRQIPVTFELLAPNGRPVQVTTDLTSFWRTGYQEVRRELRARYPKHAWPADPWTATPTHRTAKKK